MRKKLLTAIVAMSLLLSGCSSWMDGEYSSVKLHTDQSSRKEQEITQVSSYSEICQALEDMVRSAVESGILSVEGHQNDKLEANMSLAVRYIKNAFPLGAYAVEDISYEIGTTGGVAAAAVTISYNYNRSTLQKIRYVSGMEAARNLIASALNNCDTSLVIYIEDYKAMDYLQFTREYAWEKPSWVMEIPQLTVNEYPESGKVRVIELQFTYQSSREDLLAMQSYVQPVFSSAALYVSGESEEKIKFEMLSSFLMERNEYTVETSIIPAYSLLRYGVGDSRAFASVYAAMCTRAGLNCQMIAGTRDGEPWFWNIICQDGNYYHVDLLRSHSAGNYQRLSDQEMIGYVWDYSDYPVCSEPGETEEPEESKDQKPVEEAQAPAGTTQPEVNLQETEAPQEENTDSGT